VKAQGEEGLRILFALMVDWQHEQEGVEGTEEDDGDDDDGVVSEDEEEVEGLEGGGGIGDDKH